MVGIDKTYFSYDYNGVTIYRSNLYYIYHLNKKIGFNQFRQAEIYIEEVILNEENDT